jgi:hypothetical protein
MAGIKDPDILGSFAALKRAAKVARKLAEQTGTPFYVLEGGRIVNLNPGGRLRKSRRKNQKTG